MVISADAGACRHKMERGMAGLNKKRVIGFGGGAIVLIGAWLLASSAISSQAERGLQDFAARPSSETGVRLLNLHHVGGFLNSFGSFDLVPVLPDSLGKQSPPTITVTYALSHLLLPTSPARITWSAQPQGPLDAEITKALGQPLRLEGKGHLTYGGGVDTSLVLPELSLRNEGEHLSVSPSLGRLAIDAESFNLDWATDKISARGDADAVELEKLVLSIDLTDRALGLGTTILTLDKINTSTGGAEGLRHQTIVSRNGDQLDVHSSDTIRSVTVLGQTATDLVVDLGLTGLDIASLRGLKKLVNNGNDITNLTADEDQLVRQNLRTLLNKGVSFSIPKIAGKVEKGSVNGHLSFDLKPAAKLDGPVVLGPLVHASGELTVSGEVVPQQQSQFAVAMGVAVQTSDGLKAEFDYADGNLKANGRPFDAAIVAKSLKEASQGINILLDNPLRTTLARQTEEPEEGEAEPTEAAH